MSCVRMKGGPRGLHIRMQEGTGGEGEDGDRGQERVEVVEEQSGGRAKRAVRFMVRRGWLLS